MISSTWLKTLIRPSGKRERLVVLPGLMINNNQCSLKHKFSRRYLCARVLCETILLDN